MNTNRNAKSPPELASKLLLQSLSELCSYTPNTDGLGLLQSGAGEFAKDVAQIFPGDWAWPALATPRSTRMIWYALLSGLPELPDDCVPLRRNLLMLDAGLMLRLRFGGLAEAMGGIVARIAPYPLPRHHYDELAQMLAKDPSLIAWYAGQTGEIDTVELSEILDARSEDRC
jgi:hypothetical protein